MTDSRLPCRSGFKHADLVLLRPGEVCSCGHQDLRKPDIEDERMREMMRVRDHYQWGV
jgi:hypothetical protein